MPSPKARLEAAARPSFSSSRPALRACTMLRCCSSMIWRTRAPASAAGTCSPTPHVLRIAPLLREQDRAALVEQRHDVRALDSTVLGLHVIGAFSVADVG